MAKTWLKPKATFPFGLAYLWLDCGCVQVRVTLLAAGFVIGACGASVRSEPPSACFIRH